MMFNLDNLGIRVKEYPLPGNKSLTVTELSTEMVLILQQDSGQKQIPDMAYIVSRSVIKSPTDFELLNDDVDFWRRVPARIVKEIFNLIVELSGLNDTPEEKKIDS